MAVYFTGTATDKKYEVGQKYVNGSGVVKVAMPDGSFMDPKTGQVSVGSRGNMDVDWYATGNDAAAFYASRRSEPVADVAASATAPQKAPVVINGQVATPLVKASPQAVAVPPRMAMDSAAIAGMVWRPESWSGKDDPVQDALIGGFHWQANPKFSNAELMEARVGDSELIMTAYGLMVIGADIGYNANRAVKHFGPGVSKSIAQSIESGAVFDAFANWKKDLNTTVAAQNAEHQNQMDILEDAYDAIDYKLHLNKLEATKTGESLQWEVPDISNIWGRGEVQVPDISGIWGR